MVDQQPGRSKADIANALSKALIALIPGIGGSAAEIFALIFAPPLEKRRAEWLNSLAEALKQLEQEVEGFNVEELSKNEAFITCFMHATQMAIRNHQEEKLEALRSAVLNSALPGAPDEDMQLMYLQYVDFLTPWHLRILKLFEDPNKWFEEHGISIPAADMGTRSIMLEEALPALEDRRDYYEILFKDLHARGLLKTDQIHMGLTRPGVYMGIATDIGTNFLKFITAPISNSYNAIPAATKLSKSWARA